MSFRRFLTSIHKNYNFYKIFVKSNKVVNHRYMQPLNSSLVNFNTYEKTNYSYYKQNKLPFTYMFALNVLGWLGFEKDDEKKESELIMTIKRAILSTRREEYNKAETLLHIALRLAQQQQNEQGITYCYDLMANLAFDRLELDKAEKLFISVLQRLLSEGTNQDDLKVIHISLKLARICHLKAEDEKAHIGYNWCLTQIQNKINTDVDARMLYGVIQDWYAQFLLDKGDVDKSLKHLNEAYMVCNELNGYECEQTMLLLNDLAITNWRAGNIQKAESYLRDAIKIGQNLEDATYLGVMYANLGLICLQKGVLDEAKKSCQEALHIGKHYDNKESVEQANYCFDQIKQNLSQ